MRDVRRNPLVLLLFLFALAALAREPVARANSRDMREKCRFHLHKLDGEPWAGAELHLFSHPLSLTQLEPDRVSGRTDEQGRVQLELIRGRLYRGQALEELPDGLLRASDVLGDVSSRDVPRVVEMGIYQRNLFVARGIAGLGLCKLRLDSYNGSGPPIEMEIREGQEVRTPPWTSGSYELRLPSGTPIYGASWSQRLLRSQKTPRRLLVRIRRIADLELRVEDESGAPLPGVQVFDQFSRSERLVGTTNAKGLARIPMSRGVGVSKGRTRVTASFVLRHPERASYEFNKSIWGPDSKGEGERFGVAMTATMPATTERGVVVTDAEGVPWSGLRVLALVARPRSNGKPRYREYVDARTDAEGAFRLHVALPERSVRLLALPKPEERRALLPRIGTSSVCPAIWLAEGVLPAESRFSARDLIPLRVRVRAADGSGAAGARLAMYPSILDRRADLYALYPGVVGSTGSMLFLVHPKHGAPISASAWMGLASAKSGRLGPRKSPWKLQFPGRRVVSGVLRTLDGRVAPFGRLHVYWRGPAGGKRDNSKRPVRTSMTVRADARGRFRFRAPAGSRVRVTPRASLRSEKGLETWSSKSFEMDLLEKGASAVVERDVVLSTVRVARGER